MRIQCFFSSFFFKWDVASWNATDKKHRHTQTYTEKHTQTHALAKKSCAHSCHSFSWPEVAPRNILVQVPLRLPALCGLGFTPHFLSWPWRTSSPDLDTALSTLRRVIVNSLSSLVFWVSGKWSEIPSGLTVFFFFSLNFSHLTRSSHSKLGYVVLRWGFLFVYITMWAGCSIVEHWAWQSYKYKNKWNLTKHSLYTYNGNVHKWPLFLLRRMHSCILHMSATRRNLHQACKWMG